MRNGYIDDVEADIQCAREEGDNTSPDINRVKAPLLLNFDLYKIRPKAFVHGVGYYERFFAEWWKVTGQTQPDTNDSHTYMATELAYGHGSFIPTPTILKEYPYPSNQTGGYNYIEWAQLEQTHVYSVPKAIAGQTVSSIEYYNNGSNPVSASQYIKDHRKYALISDNDFMCQVKITYNNGVIVWVNRNPNTNWSITLGSTSGWLSYHAKINGNSSVSLGVASSLNNNTVILPPKNGWLVYSPVSLSKKVSESGIKNSSYSLPNSFELGNNYPNPFNPTTTIKYQLPKDGFVSLKVYDMLSREVANLVNENKKAGYYEINFDAHKLASGVYIYTLRVNDFVQSKKMILMK